MPNVPLSVIRDISTKRRIPELRGKRVLVTGGAGMIGSHLVARLAAEGAKSIVVVDDLSSGHRALVLKDSSVRFIKGSVTNPRVLDEVFRARVDIVFHLAALFANQNSVEHPIEDLRVNALGTLQLLERAHRAGVDRFVYASSSSVYSADVTLMKEDCFHFSTATPYVISKHTGERYCHYFHRHWDFPVAMVRYFNSYGPHEYPGVYRNVIPNFIERALSGKPLPIHGDGKATRDFTYVEDTVEGTCLAAVRKQAIGEVLNIGTGKETSILELAMQINRIASNKAGIEHITKRSWDKVRQRRASVKKARKLLGFNPCWKLEDGLERTCAWLRLVLAS